MAVVEIKRKDTFDIWRTKMNTISVNVGDLNLLTTPSTTDIVSAINSLGSFQTDQVRRSIIISLALN